MPKKHIFDWDDTAVRPADADTRIGWAGIPLSQTCGYYGHIKRAWIPTNDQLGFDPDYESVNVTEVATGYLARLNKAIESQNVAAVGELLYEDSHWKDVQCLTWDVRSLRGREKILRMLKERLPKTEIKDLKLNPEGKAILEVIGEDLTFILIHFDFVFEHGTGSGVMRLSPLAAKTGSATELADLNVWRIFTIGTTITTIEGWDPEFGDNIRSYAGKVRDPERLGRSYAELREAESSGQTNPNPSVIIVGAGHCGLTMAARLRVLGISHLVIEKESTAGWSWGNRYKSLSLHGPTHTNHLPCVNFPFWFPMFLPAQQLSKFLQSYAEVMDLNIWTKATIDGKSATYDEEKRRWTVTVTRADETKHIFTPKHIILATGMSGTMPQVPDVPGIAEFRAAGGIVNHSATHRTPDNWQGKKAIVVGAATSAHDISYELTECGLDVTMVQRSATHLMSVEKGIRYFYRNRERTGRPDGPSIELADRANFLRHPFAVEYELLPRIQQEARVIDHDLLEGVKKVGYKLHDGYHGGGAYAGVFFDLGGYYWDTGCCEHIANGKIQLKHSEVSHFTKDGIVYKDGTSQKADVVVFATGYMQGTKSAIQAFFGDEMAEKCGERWEKGNSFYLNSEGDSKILYRPLPQKGLWSIFHQFSFNRFNSYRLALRLKAEELGIDVTPYTGDLPIDPPNVAASRDRRPGGV
ncbi:hypothetical protein RBB50_012509 [Rhinocladiella similis]